ncbi:hypothetical protein CEXT_349461 [Caerostris extrusa]|uniref:Uncharacterized protein n=1 Tax=Caerostris extrusa TaxID=172846 RepID=A0AAV4R6C4_CAEEX|nr:hypothetical protein CEXT_349461 [Caerostris extrusa]
MQKGKKNKAVKERLGLSFERYHCPSCPLQYWTEECDVMALGWKSIYFRLRKKREKMGENWRKTLREMTSENDMNGARFDLLMGDRFYS